MSFKKGNLNQSYCAFENTQSPQQHIYKSHGNERQLFQHTQADYNYFTLSPYDNNEEQQQEKNSIFQLDDFIFPTPKEEIHLPFGWTISEKNRSIFEVETNIHTLGELYSTLIDLRNQLSPKELEQDEEMIEPLFVSRRSSSFTMSDNFLELSSRRSSSAFSISLPSSPSKDEDDLYAVLKSTYPNFIFELLLDLGISSCCCSFLHRKNIRKPIQTDKVEKSYLCAIYAYTSLHAILCHPEKFGIYSFLNNLATDSYYTAHELIEFDETSITTVETLLLMYQYLILLGKEEEARNLFCLAWRHMDMITESNYEHLLLCMIELDWSYSISKDCRPIIEPKYILKKRIKLTNIMLEDVSLQYRIKGLYLILKNRQLNEWRSKYLEVFLYKRDANNNSYTTEDKLALKLHAMYFSGMLQFYQYQMFRFEQDKNEWTDYFFTTTTKTKNQVETNLYSSMNAAYGFIQVIKLLLDEGDICQLPFMIDTLSTSFTVLYFGSKVTHKSLPKDLLQFIVEYLSKSSMVQYIRIERFVQKWNSFL